MAAGFFSRPLLGRSPSRIVGVGPCALHWYNPIQSNPRGPREPLGGRQGPLGARRGLVPGPRFGADLFGILGVRRAAIYLKDRGTL